MTENNLEKFLDYIKNKRRLEGGGHSEDLIIDNYDFRVWRSRVDNSVSLEFDLNGEWITICTWG